MAAPRNLVNVGSFVDPMKGLQQGLTAAGDIYNTYLERERQAEADKRAQEEFDLRMSEANRKIAQRDLLNKAAPQASKTALIDVQGADKAFMDSMGRVGGRAQTLFQEAEKSLANDAKFQELAANKANDYESYRNYVLDRGVPGVEGLTAREALLQPYKRYTLTKEEAEAAMAKRMAEQGVDYLTALEAAKQLSSPYKTRDTIQKERQAQLTALSEGQEKMLKRNLDLAKGYAALDKQSRGSTSKGKIPDYQTFLKNAEAIVGEGSGLFSTQGGMEDRETAMAAYNMAQQLVAEGYSPTDATAAVTMGMISGQDRDWTGVQLDKEDFLAKARIAANQFRANSGSKNGYQKTAAQLLDSIANTKPIISRVDDYETYRLEKALSPVDRAIEAFRNRKAPTSTNNEFRYTAPDKGTTEQEKVSKPVENVEKQVDNTQPFPSKNSPTEVFIPDVGYVETNPRKVTSNRKEVLLNSTKDPAKLSNEDRRLLLEALEEDAADGSIAPARLKQLQELRKLNPLGRYDVNRLFR